MNARDLAFGIAVTLASIGLLAVWTPLLDPAALRVDRLGTLVALASLAAGAGLLRRWYRTEPTTHEPAERERLAAVDVAGTDFDELLALGGSGSDEVARFYRSQARERLRAVALAVLAGHRELEEDAARRQLAAGTWTDDRLAADFFRTGADPAGPPGSALAGRLRGSPTVRRARHAVDELRRIADGERSSTAAGAAATDGERPAPGGDRPTAESDRPTDRASAASSGPPARDEEVTE